MAQRYFTVGEANATVRRIRPLVEQMIETARSVRELEGEVRPMFANAQKNGGHPKGSRFILAQHRLQQDIETIQSFGCVIKDPELGLVDFPALRDGREVELCWRFGEDRIEYWHEVNAGYRERQPL